MKTRGLRSNSRPRRFGNVDCRTAEGRLFERFRSELVKHIGGNPNVVQSAIIERCAWVRLRIALMDEKMLTGGMTDQDSKVYLAWVNTLNRALIQLGLQPPAKQPPGAALDEHIAQLRQRTRRGDAA